MVVDYVEGEDCISVCNTEEGATLTRWWKSEGMDMGTSIDISWEDLPEVISQLTAVYEHKQGGG